MVQRISLLLVRKLMSVPGAYTVRTTQERP